VHKAGQRPEVADVLELEATNVGRDRADHDLVTLGLDRDFVRALAALTRLGAVRLGLVRLFLGVQSAVVVDLHWLIARRHAHCAVLGLLGFRVLRLFLDVRLRLDSWFCFHLAVCDNSGGGDGGLWLERRVELAIFEVEHERGHATLPALLAQAAAEVHVFGRQTVLFREPG
jgi:hypothetical protein